MHTTSHPKRHHRVVAHKPIKKAKPTLPKPHPWQQPSQVIADDGPSPAAATQLVARPLGAVAGNDWVKPLVIGLLSTAVFGLAFLTFRSPERS